MTDINSAENIVSMHKYAGKLDSKASTVMRALQEANSGSLRRLTEAMLDRADDALFDLASKAESADTQQLYFEAMRTVRLQRQRVQSGFSRALAAVFDNFSAGRPMGTSEADELAEELNLSLVDEDGMEEQLALEAMVVKAERECHHELFELTVRLASLSGRNDLDETAHPFYPGAMARAFMDALSPIGIDIKVRLILLKLFEKHVLSQAKELLKDANKVLVREGILPKIRHKARKDSEDNRGAKDALFDEQAFKVPNAEMAGFAGFVPQAANFVGALSAIQVYVVENGYPTDMSPEQVGVQLLQLSRSMGVPESQSGDYEKTIGMVSMVFDYILDDANVPERVKGLIARLQIPVVKLALMDAEFFARRRHPARVLLNDIASASIGLDVERDRDSEGFIQMLEQLVARVLSEFEEDPKVFDSLLTEFRDWREQEQERAKVFEDRARKTTEGRERVEFAKRRTEAWIEMWAQRENVPPFVAEFLRTTWRNTLLITMHRHGEESREWASRIKTVNNLLWSITPKKTAKGGRLLVEMIPSILDEIREGMELSSAHPETIDAFFCDLAKVHAKTVNGGIERDLGSVPRSNKESAEARPATVSKIDQVDNPAVRALFEQDIADLVDGDVEEIVLQSPDAPYAESSVSDEFVAQIERLQCGAWLQFNKDDGACVRAKLSWRSPLTGCCLFVDRKGIKVADKSAEELAADLRCGRAEILDDVPLLDRAINALMDGGENVAVSPDA